MQYLWIFNYEDSFLRDFTIPWEYGTKTVIIWKAMTYHDYSFFLSFVKYNTSGTIIYWGKRFLLRVEEEKVLELDDADANRYQCSLVQIYKLNVPKWIGGYIRKKVEKAIFLYKYIGVDPKVIYQISQDLVIRFVMILGLSKLMLARWSNKVLIYITDELFPFSVSYKGQMVKWKCCTKGI